MGYGEPLNNESDLKGRDGIDLLARMIYAESANQSYEGKCGCAYVAKNRKDKNSKEFGGDTWEGVILKASQFAVSLKPDTSSSGWTDALDIAQNLSDKTNPIGGCLWFNTNKKYGERTRTVNGVEQYAFSNGNYKDVTEKYVIGNHTFFKITGY